MKNSRGSKIKRILLVNTLMGLHLFGVVACGNSVVSVTTPQNTKASFVKEEMMLESGEFLACSRSDKNHEVTKARLMYDDHKTFLNKSEVKAKDMSSTWLQQGERFKNRLSFKEDAPLLSEEELQKRLWNRSFSLSYINSCIRNVKNEEMNFGEIGRTIWLLDYAYDKTNNRYKLFFGTNLKTANELRYFGLFSTDEFAYGQFKSNKRENANIFLGKSINPFSSNKNKYGVFFSKKGVTRKLREDILNGKKEVGNSSLWSQIIDSPKITFAAVDFMKQDATKDIDFHWLKKYTIFQYIFQEPKFESEKDFEKIEEILEIPADYRMQEFRDFAVIEMNFNAKKITEILNSLDKSSQDYLDLSLYKKLIFNAIQEVDSTQEEQKRFNFKNKDNSSNNFWDTIDRASALLVSQTKTNKNVVPFIPSVFGGYTVQEFVDKNVSGQEEYLEFSKRVISDIGDEKLTFVSSGASGEEFRDTFYHRFGFLNQIYQRDESKNSGTLVLNNQGVPVGITTGRYVIWDYKNKEKRVPMWIESYEEFNQVLPLDFVEKDGEAVAMRSFFSFLFPKYSSVENFVYKTPSFNLIDGTDSEKYPLQKKSYRSALMALYPNGVFNDGDTSTALFEDYMKS